MNVSHVRRPLVDLQWTQPRALSRVYDLSAGGEPVARLETTGFARHGARLTSGVHAWRIEARGFLVARFVVLDGGGREVATFEGGWLGGGTVAFAEGGLVLRWRPTSWLRREWVFEDEGIAVVRMRPRIELLRSRIDAEIERQTLPDDAAVLLLGLGLVLIRRARRASAH